MYYFSVNNDGFYNSDSGVQIPDDAIELTYDQYVSFFETMNKENKKLVLENGQLVLKSRVNTVTWDMIRQKRNTLLTESDYTQMPDYPTKKTEWAQYRQLLRDIPDMFSDPSDVIWPNKPI